MELFVSAATTCPAPLYMNMYYVYIETFAIAMMRADFDLSWYQQTHYIGK